MKQELETHLQGLKDIWNNTLVTKYNKQTMLALYRTIQCLERTLLLLGEEHAHHSA